MFLDSFNSNFVCCHIMLCAFRVKHAPMLRDGLLGSDMRTNNARKVVAEDIWRKIKNPRQLESRRGESVPLGF